MKEIIDQFVEGVRLFGVPVLICQTGSTAYGLNTPESDIDARGVFVPNLDYLLGLKEVEQVKVKGDDWVCHDIRQYIKLLIKQNPTIMELLFIEEGVQTTSFWKLLAPKLRQLITKKAFVPYSAYVKSQLMKAENRQPIGKRARIVEEVGYDCKFMSHCARLAVQCVYLMKEAYIPVKVPEPFRSEIMKIKQGLVSREDAVKYCKELDVRMYEAYKATNLPEEVNINRFEQNVYIPLMESILRRQYRTKDEGAFKMTRASGDCLCPICNDKYSNHFDSHHEFQGEPFLKVLCNGDYVKL